jgi:hypothetical protein
MMAFLIVVVCSGTPSGFKSILDPPSRTFSELNGQAIPKIQSSIGPFSGLGSNSGTFDVELRQ